MPVKKTQDKIPFEMIVADLTFNSRQEYTGIDELASSIYNEGLLQPLGVAKRERDDGTEYYFLVYGFRRYHALHKLREAHGDDYYMEVPVMIKEGSLDSLRILNLKENLDRTQLSNYEVAQQIRRMTEAGFDQRTMAQRLGKPQSWVSNMYKLATQLSPAVQNALRDGDLSVDHALYLAEVPETEQKGIVEQMLQAPTKVEARNIAKEAATEAGKKRNYKGRMRPSAKNLLEMVSEMSFNAESTMYTQAEKDFYHGVAAGLRIAAGDQDVDPKRLDPVKNSYKDTEYHQKAKKVSQLPALEPDDREGGEPERDLDAEADELAALSGTPEPKRLGAGAPLQVTPDEPEEAADVLSLEPDDEVVESRVERLEHGAVEEDGTYTYESMSEIQSDDPVEPPKKRRGRPPGSKNKPKDVQPS